MRWQKNFNKFPKEAKEKIAELEARYLKVVCVKNIPKADIVKGDYDHIDIKSKDDEVIYKAKIVPDIKNGRYSKYNKIGRTIPRDDLPRVVKPYTYERPNFGDYTKGTHDISYSRKVKQKEIWLPKAIPIKITLLEQKNDIYTFKFEIDDIIDKNASEYEDDVMFHINLLQENCGCYDIHTADITDAELTRTLYVDWELLPPGSNEIEQFIESKRGEVSETEYDEIIGRYKFIESLEPLELIKGTNKFSKYFGAKFSEEIVVLENINYGNAIYIFYEDWEKLTKLTRTELLNMKTDKFTRIVHTRDWKKRLKGSIFS